MPRIVVFQGSPRIKNNCPDQDSKTKLIVDMALKNLPDTIDIDLIEMGVEEDNIVQPCKGCVGTAGGYHCLPASERVHMVDGTFKSIADIKIGDEVIGGRVSWAKLTNPQEEVYKIIISDGRVLRATANHPIKVIRPHYNNSRKKLLKYEEEWVKVRDLKEEDRIPIKLGGNFPETRFDLRHCFIAGAVFGDGSYNYNPRNNQTNLSIYYHPDSPIKSIIQELIPNQYKEAAHYTVSCEMRRARLHSTVFRPILDDIGLDKTPPVEKRRIPSGIMNGSLEEIAAYLDGWICTDGTVVTTNHKADSIRIFSKSYGALRDAQILLAKMEIRSCVRDQRHLKLETFGSVRERTSYLHIDGNQANKFASIITISDHKKRNKLLLREYRTKGKRLDYYGTVKSVVPDGSEAVYDITVEPGHEFVAEGITIHNCHWPCDCYGPESANKEISDLMHDQDVYNKLEKADGFVVFSPIHWYSVSTQVKAAFDRLVCSSMSLTAKQAQELGIDKDAEISRAYAKDGRFDKMLKNHLEGKVAGFFIHGDDGANDYSGKRLPRALTAHEEHELKANDPKQALAPLVAQCRYSGINVPDDCIVGVHINLKVDYATANDKVRTNKRLFAAARNLIIKVARYAGRRA